MKSTTAWLCSAVIVSAILRGLQAGESLWLDELHTSWTVTGSLSEVAERAAIGNQSPLYFWLTWFFARMPLPPEIALRLPSLLTGCALPVAVYWLAKKLLQTDAKPDDKPADDVPLVAAWLVAIDPRAIFYSQEARPYSLLVLAAVAHLALLLSASRSRDWRVRVLWVMTGAALVHLNYTGGLILIAEFTAIALWITMSAIGSGKLRSTTSNAGVEFLSTYWIDIVALVLLVMPSFPGALDVAARRENWQQFVKPQPWLEIWRMFPWTPAIAALLVLNSWRSAVSQRSLVLLTCWLLIPLCIAWTTTHFDIAALFNQRYLIAVLPASLIAAAFCIRLGPNATTQSVLVGIVLAVSVANCGLAQNWLADGRFVHARREDWRSAVAELNRRLSADASNAPVLVRSGLIEADALPQDESPLFAEYCLSPVRGMYWLQSDKVYPLTTNDPGKLPPKLRDQLKGEQSLWLLIRTSQSSVREQLLFDLRETIEDEEVWLPEKPVMFGNLYLQRVQLRKPLPAAGN